MSADNLEEQTETATSTIKGAFDSSIVEKLPVRLTAQLGSVRMRVSELMALENGSVVTLDSSLNHLADLYLDGRVIARGEIVAVDDKFGLKITEIA